jgi:hypothetical protein
MVAAHYAYNMIKIPATWGVLTIRADIRDTVFCVEEMHKAVVAGEPGDPSEAMVGGRIKIHALQRSGLPQSLSPWCVRASALRPARASSWVSPI